jgi:hypothetical protein
MPYHNRDISRKLLFLRRNVTRMQEPHRVFRKGSYTCGPENHPYSSGKRLERALKELKEMHYAVALNSGEAKSHLTVWWCYQAAHRHLWRHTGKSDWTVRRDCPETDCCFQCTHSTGQVESISSMSGDNTQSVSAIARHKVNTAHPLYISIKPSICFWISAAKAMKLTIRSAKRKSVSMRAVKIRCS